MQLDRDLATLNIFSGNLKKVLDGFSSASMHVLSQTFQSNEFDVLSGLFRLATSDLRWKNVRTIILEHNHLLNSEKKDLLALLTTALVRHVLQEPDDFVLLQDYLEEAMDDDEAALIVRNLYPGYGAYGVTGGLTAREAMAVVYLVSASSLNVDDIIRAYIDGLREGFEVAFDAA